MNSDTRLEFPSKFADNKREIVLSGEAYLEIAKNKSKSFFVRLPSATVEVTGTRFNVNTYAATLTKVALVEGGVNLRSGKNITQISPGNEAIYDNSSQKMTKQPFNAKKTLSWREGFFFFEGASLTEISPVLWRWFGITTKVDQPELLNKKFVGVLNKAESVETFLDNLKAISGIEGYFDKDGVLHFR